MKLHQSLLAGAGIALFFATSTSKASSDDGDYERRDDLTEAVVSCEEAYARLQKCCPGYSAWVGYDKKRSPCLDLEWQETSSGCFSPSTVDRGDTEPLALRESECIREMSCEDLVAKGVCARAKSDRTIVNESGRSATRRICP